MVDEIVARLPIHNHGGELLEVILETYGEDYHLRPGESLVIHTAGVPGRESTWPGTTRGDEPFDINCYPGSIQVYFNGIRGWVTDLDGTDLDCGHQRPEPRPGGDRPS